MEITTTETEEIRKSFLLHRDHIEVEDLVIWKEKNKSTFLILQNIKDQQLSQSRILLGSMGMPIVILPEVKHIKGDQWSETMKS
jgi:hypothetical protein